MPVVLRSCFEAISRQPALHATGGGAVPVSNSSARSRLRNNRPLCAKVRDSAFLRTRHFGAKCFVLRQNTR